MIVNGKGVANTSRMRYSSLAVRQSTCLIRSQRRIKQLFVKELTGSTGSHCQPPQGWEGSLRNWQPPQNAEGHRYRGGG